MSSSGLDRSNWTESGTACGIIGTRCFLSPRFVRPSEAGEILIEGVVVAVGSYSVEVMVVVFVHVDVVDGRTCFDTSCGCLRRDQRGGDGTGDNGGGGVVVV